MVIPKVLHSSHALQGCTRRIFKNKRAVSREIGLFAVPARRDEHIVPQEKGADPVGLYHCRGNSNLDFGAGD